MSHPISTQFLKLLPLVLLVAGLLSYNFISAQWQAPTATAPNNNTAVPINISANYQAKLGDLGAVRMRAGQYCNADGTVCSVDITGGGLGMDQRWYDVRGSRSTGVSYQNNTTKPIQISFQRGTVDGFNNIEVSLNNSTWVNTSTCWRGNSCSGVIVPPGQWYRITGTNVVGVWSELR